MNLNCPTPWVTSESVGPKHISGIFTSKPSLLSTMWQYKVGGSLETMFLSFLYCLRRYQRAKSSTSESDAMQVQEDETEENARRQGTLTKRNGGKRKGCDDKAQMGRSVLR